MSSQCECGSECHKTSKEMSKTERKVTVLGMVSGGLLGGILLLSQICNRPVSKSLVGRFELGTNLVEMVEFRSSGQSAYTTKVNGKEILRTNSPEGFGAFLYEPYQVSFDSARGPYIVNSSNIVENIITNSVPLD